MHASVFTHILMCRLVGTQTARTMASQCNPYFSYNTYACIARTLQVSDGSIVLLGHRHGHRARQAVRYTAELFTKRPGSYVLRSPCILPPAAVRPADAGRIHFRLTRSP
jgi:hypothetical protein